MIPNKTQIQLNFRESELSLYDYCYQSSNLLFKLENVKTILQYSNENVQFTMVTNTKGNVIDKCQKFYYERMIIPYFTYKTLRF